MAFLDGKQTFDEAGVAAAPRRLDEFFAARRALANAGVDPVALEGSLAFFHFCYATCLLDQIAGPDCIRTPVADPTGEAWRSPKATRTLELARALWDEGCIPEVSRSYQGPTAQQNLAVGVAAVELVGSWGSTELVQATDPDFGWGAFAFPTVERGINANTLDTAMMAIRVDRSSEDQEVATDLIR